jgi:hypothetical protein
MEVENPAMMQVALSGDMRVANVEEMTKLLEASSGFTMRIKGKTIYVTYH